MTDDETNDAIVQPGQSTVVDRGQAEVREGNAK